MRQGRTASDRLTDQELLQCLAEGKLEALSVLYERYASRLYPLALSWLGRADLAEDVVQEVFVRAFTERAKRKNISRVGPYLYRMVINTCTDMLRRRKRSGVSLESLQINEISGRQNNPAEMAAAKDELYRVEELLKRLPRNQAEVIRLRVFDELHLSEIAEVVGCSMNTVHSRLRYGFRKLRKIVSRERK